MPVPDYQGGSIVNLMTSIIQAYDDEQFLYPPLRHIDPALLRNARNIVLLVIDGLGYEFLTETGRNSTLHSHLKTRITSVYPPTTATAITTFLTGMAPQQHGLPGWFTYFKELGDIIAVLPFRPRHGGPPLGEAGISAEALFGHFPVFDRIDVPSYVVSPEWIADSDFNLAHTGKARITPYARLPQCFRTVKDIIRGDERRKYIYAYWPGLDNLAHEAGIGGRIAADHFAEIDNAFRHFLKTVEGTGTVVIVTADHGIIDSGPERCIDLEAHPVLTDMLALPLCGDRRNAYCYVQADRCKQFEDYVQSELADSAQLLESRMLIEDGYFGLGSPHPRLADRIGDYTLAMRGELHHQGLGHGRTPFHPHRLPRRHERGGDVRTACCCRDLKHACLAFRLGPRHSVISDVSRIT